MWNSLSLIFIFYFQITFSSFIKTNLPFLQVHMNVGLCGGHYWCVRDFDSYLLWPMYETYILILVLILPTAIMAATYTAICSAIFTMVVLRRSMMEHS